MTIDPERLNAFQARMNGWVSSQGLLFQLRHGGAVHGAKSSFMSGVFRLLLHLVLAAGVLMLVMWVYLAKRVDYGSFRENLSAQMAGFLRADTVEIAGVGRQRGNLALGQVSIEGGEGSFLEAAELRGVRTRMGLLDGMLGTWDGGDLVMKELRIKVKSGADDDAEAGKAFSSLFHELEGFRFESLMVEEATVFWGYSQMHRGGVRDSKMKATRDGDGWKVVFTGGQFSQNWLKNLDIDRIVVLVTPSGVSIPEMTLGWGEGVVTCQLAFVEGGARPKLSGSGTMTGVPVGNVLKPEFRDFIQGQFSATFEVDGSTNSQEGIGMTLNLELGEEDKIELRDRFQLLAAVSTVDRFRSYKRVRLTTGRCRIRTGGGEMQVDDIFLVDKDLMQLEGSFHARPPTEDEIKALLDFDKDQTVGGGLPVGMEDPLDGGGDELTLKGAAKKDETSKGDDGAAVPGLNAGSILELEKDAVLRQQQSQLLIGEVRVGFTKDTFSRSPSLEAYYPVAEDGMRWVHVPMKGNIFSVGVKEAGEIYQQRRGER